MIVNEGYFINDNRSSFSDLGNIVNKFDFIDSEPNTFLLYELWYLRINNRVVKRSEYGVSTTNAPLTTLRLGQGGQPITQGTYLIPTPSYSPEPPPLNLGFDNYTNFINNIFRRHGIKSRFYPMGKNYIPLNPTYLLPPQSTGLAATNNLVGCNLSLLEDFCLIFREIPPLELSSQNIAISSVHVIETNGNMSLKGLIRTFPNNQREFNTLSSPTGTTQIILDQTSFFTEKRYKPNNPTL